MSRGVAGVALQDNEQRGRLPCIVPGVVCQQQLSGLLCSTCGIILCLPSCHENTSEFCQGTLSSVELLAGRCSRPMPRCLTFEACCYFACPAGGAAHGGNLLPLWSLKVAAPAADFRQLLLRPPGRRLLLASRTCSSMQDADSDWVRGPRYKRSCAGIWTTAGSTATAGMNCWEVVRGRPCGACRRRQRERAAGGQGRGVRGGRRGE